MEHQRGLQPRLARRMAARARRPVTARARRPVTARARRPVTARARRPVMAPARRPVTVRVRNAQLRYGATPSYGTGTTPNNGGGAVPYNGPGRLPNNYGAPSTGSGSGIAPLRARPVRIIIRSGRFRVPVATIVMPRTAMVRLLPRQLPQPHRPDRLPTRADPLPPVRGAVCPRAATLPIRPLLGRSIASRPLPVPHRMPRAPIRPTVRLPPTPANRPIGLAACGPRAISRRGTSAACRRRATVPTVRESFPPATRKPPTAATNRL